MVTTREKYVVSTQKNTTKKSKQQKASKIKDFKTHDKTKQDNKQGTMDLQNSQKIIDNKMALVSPYLSIISLNAKGLKSPIKRHRMPE